MDKRVNWNKQIPKYCASWVSNTDLKIIDKVTKKISDFYVTFSIIFKSVQAYELIEADLSILQSMYQRFFIVLLWLFSVT